MLLLVDASLIKNHYIKKMIFVYNTKSDNINDSEVLLIKAMYSVDGDVYHLAIPGLASIWFENYTNSSKTPEHARKLMLGG